jgi:hypothetical protein
MALRVRPDRDGRGLRPAWTNSAPAHASIAPTTASQRPRQPTHARTSGAATIVIAIPNGMYELHSPSVSLRSAGAVAEKINAGSDTVSARNPAPSTTRDARSHPPDGANAPATPPAARSATAPAANRSAPMRSAPRPNATAAAAAIVLKIDTTQPAATSDRPNSSFSAGSAGGSLPA